MSVVHSLGKVRGSESSLWLPKNMHCTLHQLRMHRFNYHARVNIDHFPHKYPSYVHICYLSIFVTDINFSQRGSCVISVCHETYPAWITLHFDLRVQSTSLLAILNLSDKNIGTENWRWKEITPQGNSKRLFLCFSIIGRTYNCPICLWVITPHPDHT